jgi:hypothetical protein
MASIPPKRSRESDDEDDAHDQLVDPARQSSTSFPSHPLVPRTDALIPFAPSKLTYILYPYRYSGR